MKAAIVETPNKLVVRDIPEPQIGPYDVRCDVLYGAICTGTDRHIIEGCFPWPVQYPIVLGHESVGRITQVGNKVRNLKVGDVITRVGTRPSEGLHVNWGGFVEVAVGQDYKAMEADGLPRHEWGEARRNLIVPPDIDPAAATMIVTWRETLSFVQRMAQGNMQGSRVLVIGSGGNALAIVAHCDNLGAAQVTVVGSEDRREASMQAGAVEYIDYRGKDVPSVIRENCPEGFDFAFDGVGKKGQLDLAVGALKPGGTVGMYGLDDLGETTINPVKARGTFTFYKGGYDENEVHDQVIQYMREGKLDARIWLDLDHPYQLADISDAFEALARRQNIKGIVRIKG